MQTNTRITDQTRMIGANLRIMREAAGFSQYEVARILGVSYQQIQKYEAGQNRFPIEKLFQLKNFYDVPYELFFKGVFSLPGGDQNQGAEQKRGAAIYAHVIDRADTALKEKIEKIVLVLLN